MYGLAVVLALVCQIAFVWWFHTTVSNLIDVMKKAWEATNGSGYSESDFHGFIVCAVLAFWLVLPWLGFFTVLVLTGAFLRIKYDVMKWIREQGKRNQSED